LYAIHLLKLCEASGDRQTDRQMHYCSSNTQERLILFTTIR